MLAPLLGHSALKRLELAAVLAHVHLARVRMRMRLRKRVGGVRAYTRRRRRRRRRRRGIAFVSLVFFYYLLLLLYLSLVVKHLRGEFFHSGRHLSSDVRHGRAQLRQAVLPLHD